MAFFRSRISGLNYKCRSEELELAKSRVVAVWNNITERNKGRRRRWVVTAYTG
ncbi:unnamed protein product [Dovyalis caffra]|uniref:Uncharacterized protein n=1 Tax=Dovyalis caffra TaxID=77055 RepID=A0AAV1R1K1_9ROSI|nr:unnamed protein product [Dovyalis caffra]